MDLSFQNNKKTYIGTAVGLVLLWYFTKGAGTSSSGQPTDPTGNGYTTGTTTFSAYNVAMDLYNEMKGWNVISPTDDSKILSILTHVTPQQFSQVVASFGNLAYNETDGDQISWAFETLPKLPLRTWLKDEVSDATYTILKSKYPNDL